MKRLLLVVLVVGAVFGGFSALSAAGTSPAPVRAGAGAPTFQHVSYLSAGGRVDELYYPLGGGSWGNNDLNAATRGPSAIGGSALTSWESFVHEYAYHHIVYLAANRHVRELIYYQVGAGWGNNDLSVIAQQEGCQAVGGTAVTSWVVNEGSYTQDFVTYFGVGGDVCLLEGIGGFWDSGDLTAAVGAPPVPGDNALTSWWDGSFEHIVYVTPSNGHVHELFCRSGGSWGNNDLTAASGGPPAVSGSALTSWWDGTYQHVIYLSADGHVQELFYRSGGSWGNNDLTAASGGPPAVGGSALTSWVG